MEKHSPLLRKVYSSIPEKEWGILHELQKKWEKNPPLMGYKLLVNCHLTMATLIMIDTLLCSGAEVVITCSDNLSFHDDAIHALVEHGISYIKVSELLTEYSATYFDVVIDCGASLYHLLKPRIGFTELTRTTPSIYTKSTVPIISVDMSETKRVETTYGTGDGFVRGIKMIERRSGNNTDLLRNNIYMVFGYGKVGRGIAWATGYLLDAPKAHLIIIEENEHRLKEAQADGYCTYLLGRDNEAIITALQKTDICITATGNDGAVEKHFTPNCFNTCRYLVNMGTNDEWGKSFHSKQLLNNGKPLNFMLQFPTKVMYLDPIFATLCKATVYLCTNTQLSHQLHALPSTIDDEVLTQWLYTHQIDNFNR